MSQTVTSVAVSEYCIAQLKAGGAIAPLETLNVPTTADVEDEAFDASGNLWVLKIDAAPGNSITESILKYSAAQLAALHTNPSPVAASTLTSTALNNPVAPGIALAFDASGDLWASTYGSIVEFSAAQIATGGMQTPVVTLTPTGPVTPSRLTFDAGGNLWFVDATLVYASPSIHELSRASLGTSGSPAPVVSLSAPTPSYMTPISQIACSWNDLAFDTAGNLWGGESGYYFRFGAAQLATANAAPAIFIGIAGDSIAGLQVTGPATSIAVDRNGDLFGAVSSTYGGGAAYSFYTFAPSQYGANPPAGTSDPALGNLPSVFAIAAGPYVP